MSMILLFVTLTIINVILQTFKSLCTVRCSTFVSACVNAIAYGLYTFVIFYTTADGMSLMLKAAITAIANFFGVYVANAIFEKCFSRTIRWKVDVSVPDEDRDNFEDALQEKKLEYCYSGWYKGWTQFSVFCPDKVSSACLKSVLPSRAKYNISECVKIL